MPTIYKETFKRCIKPIEPLTVSQWSDSHIYLPQKAAAEPGLYRTDRTPYMQEIMDCFNDSAVERVVFLKAAQVGATQCLANMIGYVIDHQPAPVMMVQPTSEMAKRLSRQRIQSMVDASPALSEKIRPARERDSGNTMLAKDFTGGTLVMTGANSAVGLRSMSAKYLLLDEVDGYPLDIDGEGDPISLAEKRTLTFPNRKIYIISTPTEERTSRIWFEFLQSDQRHYNVPCPHCGHMQSLTWSNIKFDPKNLDEPVQYLCEDCGVLIDEHYKTEMLKQGQWIATHPESKIRGYSLNSLYSPLGWKSWKQCVQEFLSAKDDVALLKTWTNTVLGEVWKQPDVDSIDFETIYNKRESYAAEVPQGALCLTAGVDVQGNRLEVSVVGWGKRWETFVIDHVILSGDPLQPAVWDSLDQVLTKKYTHQSGHQLSIYRTFVDAGNGVHTAAVYAYCRPRQNRGVFAIKGFGNVRWAQDMKWSRATEGNDVCNLAVDAMKDIIFTMMVNGQMHFPHHLQDEYFRQLTAESAVEKMKMGRLIRVYEKNYSRNETLDCMIYSYSAARSFPPAFDALANTLEKKSENNEKNSISAPVTDSSIMSTHQPRNHQRLMPQHTRQNWVNRY